MKKLLFTTISILLIISCGSESGCLQGDCQNQTSTYVWDNGDQYEGGFVDGYFHGQGAYIHANGDKYTGEWRSGKRNGQGTFTSSDGSSYVGEWKGDKRSGLGTYTSKNGYSWTGEWKNDEQGKGYSNTENYYNPKDVIGEIESTAIRLSKLNDGSELYHISLLIGNIKEDFIFDTGATTISLSLDFLNKLKKGGVGVKQLDIYGATAKLANGQEIPIDYALLNNIRIGDYVLNNVVVMVSENEEFNLLFGSGVLNKFSDWNVSKEGILNLYR